MPKSDQLEIIQPDGNIHFYNLNPEKGIITIGRHPDNDVVIDSPSVGSFHAVVDHQRKPYRIMFLSEESNARTRGQDMAANNFQSWNDWQTIDLDGYTITLLEDLEGPTAAVVPQSNTATVPSIVPSESSVGVSQVPILVNPVSGSENAPALADGAAPRPPWGLHASSLALWMRWMR